VNNVAAVIQPQVSRQTGDGDTHGEDSTTNSDDATHTVRRKSRRSAVARPRGSDVRRSGQATRAAPGQRSRGQSKPRILRPRRPR
jgi:hypothetical protein